MHIAANKADRGPCFLLFFFIYKFYFNKVMKIAKAFDNHC